MKGIDVIVEQAGSRYQIAVVRVLGQIDTTTSHELERRLQYLLKDHQFEIVIDLGKVTYISSAGWGIFISEIRGIRESGGDLKLVGMTPEVAEVFQLLEFHNILESFKTVEAAVERFERPKAPPVQEKHRLGESIKDSAPVGGGDARQVIEPVAEGRGIRGSESATQADASRGSGTGIQDDVTSDSRWGGDAGNHSSRADTSGTSNPAWSTSRTATSKAPGADETPGRHGASRTSSETDRTGGHESSAGQTGIGETGEQSGAGSNSDEVTMENAAAPIAGKSSVSCTHPVSKDLEAMILEIVRENPDHGCLKIRKELLEHDYRRPINPLTLFMELKRLNLETKEKRKRYADSFATVGSKK